MGRCILPIAARLTAPGWVHLHPSLRYDSSPRRDTVAGSWPVGGAMPDALRSRLIPLPLVPMCAEGKAAYVRGEAVQDEAGELSEGAAKNAPAQPSLDLKTAAWTPPTDGESAALIDAITELVADAIWLDLSSDLSHSDASRLLPQGEPTEGRKVEGRKA